MLLKGETTVSPGYTNHLYYGDNLNILREHIRDESIDLIYLDPPFNSQATYNILFRAPTGERSQAQIEAFEDAWHWNEHAERAFDEVVHSGNTDIIEMLRAMRTFLKENDMMAYLTMMAIRLIELHRVLKPTGSIYLHCDPTASHYLKLLLDAAFGPRNFRNEIIWKRTTAHSNVYINYGDIVDNIFFYTKTETYRWNQLYTKPPEDERASLFPHVDADGRRWRSENMRNPGIRPNLHYPYTASNGITYYPHPNGWTISLERMQARDVAGKLHFPLKATGRLRLKLYEDEWPGVKLQNLWDDISPIGAQAQERLGYPTQKPLPLLERIIQASSHEGDVVLDPFCGCGTAVHAAQKLGRHWMGIDITHLAISLIEKRLNDAFPGIQYDVHGTPKDLAGAQALADQDKYQFQWWAVSLVNAVPYGGKKKGADSGIDGLIYFKPDGKQTEKAIVSVKGGGSVSVPMIRDLAHVVDREQAKIGIFVTLAPPTSPMQVEATKAGFYETAFHGKVPKIQILSIADLFQGKKPQIPFIDPTTFRRAQPEPTAEQGRLF
jgi:site-specific DNA-methyltransferase (adenine-specific)